jgi:hypothetical protein
MWQIVKGLEEMGVIEKGCGGCPDSRIYEAVQELKDRADKSEENYQFMVKKAIDNHLPAYREMGDKLCTMEEQRDEARMALGQATKALERSLAGKPIRNADEIIMRAQTVLGNKNA